MNQVIEMPLWGLLACWGVWWATAWLNAWLAMRLVRRNGQLTAPLGEMLEQEQVRRTHRALRGADGVLPEEFDGRVVE
jgi:hypothetical protein